MQAIIIKNKKDNESYIKNFASIDEAKTWVTNHLDLSKDWEVETRSPIIINREKKQALQQHLKDSNLSEIKVSEYDENLFHVNDWDEEYFVLTDEEADEYWEATLNDYVYECLEIPKHLLPYFDDEKWKNDARMDGRGHSLNHYDGSEEEETVNGTTYYIYRRI